MGSIGVDISFLDENTASFNGNTDMIALSEEEITSLDKQNPPLNAWPLQMTHLNSVGSTTMTGTTPGSDDMDDFQQTAQFFFPEFHSSKQETKHGQLHDILRKDSNQYSQLFIKKTNSSGQAEQKQRILASRSQPRLHQQTPMKSSRQIAQGEMRFPALSFKEDKQLYSGRPISLRYNNTRQSVHHNCEIQRQPEFQKNNENIDNYSFNNNNNNNNNNYLLTKQGSDSNIFKNFQINTANSSVKSKQNQNIDVLSQSKPFELPDKDSDSWNLQRIPLKVPSSSSSSSSVSTSTSTTSKLTQQQSLISLPIPPNHNIMTFGFAKTNRNLIQPTLPVTNYFQENPMKNLMDENLLDSLKKQQILYNRIRQQQQSQQQSQDLEGRYTPKSFTTPDKQQLESKSSNQDPQQYFQEGQSHLSQFPILNHSQSSHHITQTQPNSCKYLKNDIKTKEYLRQSKPQVTMDSIVPDSIQAITRQQMIGLFSSGHTPNTIRHSYNPDPKFQNTKSFQKDPPLMINFGSLKKRIDFEENTVNSVAKQTTTSRDTNLRRKFHSLHQAQGIPSLVSIHGVDINSQQSLENDLENARTFIRQTISNGNGYKVLQQFQQQNLGSSTNKQTEIFSEQKRTGCCPPMRKLSSPPPSPLLSDARFLFSEETFSSKREANTADTTSTASSQMNKINESKLKKFLQRKPQENILNRIFHNQNHLIETRE